MCCQKFYWGEILILSNDKVSKKCVFCKLLNQMCTHVYACILYLELRKLRSKLPWDKNILLRKVFNICVHRCVSFCYSGDFQWLEAWVFLASWMCLWAIVSIRLTGHGRVRKLAAWSAGQSNTIAKVSNLCTVYIALLYMYKQSVMQWGVPVCQYCVALIKTLFSLRRVSSRKK